MILVTGGTGFIGSHTCVALQEAGYEVLLFDNLSNSRPKVLHRIEKITGGLPNFIEGDVRCQSDLKAAFAQFPIEAVVHFAALKAVGESVDNPLEYYDHNIQGSLVLLKEMQEAGVKTMVFSSTAAVYGLPDTLPITEDTPMHPTNPYGRSKLMVEQILADLYESDCQWKIAVLRYFNAAGAHESGLIGEDPKGTSHNLMPNISRVAAGQQKKLHVYGDDYPTPDGTAIRDYIHVLDLSSGHVAALRHLFKHGGHHVLNLGVGKGVSVLEIVKAYERACGRAIPIAFSDRRPGDVPEMVSNSELANATINWHALLKVDRMCEDAWRWMEQVNALNKNEMGGKPENSGSLGT